MGSGGVGGFFGGRLANAGEDVRFVARGAHLQALRTDGLTIENEPQGDIHVVGVRASADPKELGPADLVIVSVKLWDTESAARQIEPLIGAHTAVLSLQNETKQEIKTVGTEISEQNRALSQASGGNTMTLKTQVNELRSTQSSLNKNETKIADLLRRMDV